MDIPFDSQTLRNTISVQMCWYSEFKADNTLHANPPLSPVTLITWRVSRLKQPASNSLPRYVLVQVCACSWSVQKTVETYLRWPRVMWDLSMWFNPGFSNSDNHSYHQKWSKQVIAQGVCKNWLKLRPSSVVLFLFCASGSKALYSCNMSQNWHATYSFCAMITCNLPTQRPACCATGQGCFV